jgi:hypothetical protein
MLSLASHLPFELLRKQHASAHISSFSWRSDNDRYVYRVQNRRPALDMILSHANQPQDDLTSAQDVDAALCKVAELARKLRATRNSFVLINRLPPELLGMIFTYLRARDQTTFSSVPLHLWYKVTHVCQRWREIALGFPLLWTDIDSHAPAKRIEQMIMRSKNASLEFKAHASKPSAETLQAWKLITPHLSRMQLLHLSIDETTFQALLPVTKTTGLEMQRLKSLVISNLNHFDDERLALPMGLFSKGCPRLECLSIQHCTIPWTMPLLLACPQLKQLTLQGHQSISPTIPQLLHMLELMPVLEHLRLENVLPLPHVSSTGENLPTVHPQYLRTLVLHGTAPEITCFLKHVHISPHVVTSIVCLTPSDIGELSSLATALGPFLDTREGAPFAHKFCISVTAYRMRVHVTTGDGMMERTPSWVDLADEQCSLMLTIRTSNSRRFLAPLVRSLPLDALTFLAVEDDRGVFNLEVLRSVLNSVPNIHTLQVCQEAGRYVAEALGAEASGVEGGIAPLVLAKLEHLILHEIDMGWVYRHTSFLNRLQEMQFLRSIRAQPILELSTIKCSNITVAEIRVLSHLFVEVHSDGSEIHAVGDEQEWNEVRELWDMWEGHAVGWHS